MSVDRVLRELIMEFPSRASGDELLRPGELLVLRQQAGLRRLPKWVDELKALRDRVQELEKLLTFRMSGVHIPCASAASDIDHGCSNRERDGCYRSERHRDHTDDPSEALALDETWRSRQPAPPRI